MPTVHVDGVDLYYETAGDGDALLLIHALGSSCRDWERQIPAFSAHYKVIAIDLRGHGRSGKPPGPYSIPLFAADTASLLDALNLMSAHVVGLSLGGMVAFQLAVSWPGLVRSLVIVNAGPEFTIRTPGQRLLLMQRLAVMRLMGMRGIGKFLSRRLFPEPQQELLRRQMVDRFSQNDPCAYREALRAIAAGWTVEEHLARIRCATLVIAADGDYTPVAYKAAYVAKLPHGQLRVIEDSRHATPVDQPEEFNKAVLAFLK
jgi:pimeloyl-ACP methyl ester carboxylesterase